MIKTKQLLTGLTLACFAAAPALADNASTFGPEYSASITTGQSYAGLTFTATGLSNVTDSSFKAEDANNGSGGFDQYTTSITLYDDYDGVNRTFNIHTDQPATFGPSGAEGFASTFKILAGIASDDTTVTVSVRKPNDNEVFGYSTVPPMDNSPGWISLLSDVWELNGIAAPVGGQVDGDKVQTDVFAIEISYLDNEPFHTNTTPEAYLEDYIYEHGTQKSQTEATLAAKGELQLAFFDTATGQYTDDDLGNFNSGTTVIENYQGSYADFEASLLYAPGGLEADLADYLGSWGVDTSNNTVWAIVDHNTAFVTVPEPGSLAMVLLSCLLLVRRRRG